MAEFERYKEYGNKRYERPYRREDEERNLCWGSLAPMRCPPRGDWSKVSIGVNYEEEVRTVGHESQNDDGKDGLRTTHGVHWVDVNHYECDVSL